MSLHRTRIVALKRYEKVSNTDKTFVNFSLDTVYLGINHNDSDAIGPSENEARIQFLAIDIAWLDVAEVKTPASVEKLGRKFGRCKGLRKLILMVSLSDDITEQREAKLSISIAKYENNIYSDLEGIDMSFYSGFDFNIVCDVISMHGH